MPAIRHASHNRLIWAALVGLLLASRGVSAEQPVAWKTGAVFNRQLREIVPSPGVTLRGSALRDGLDRLSRAYGVAAFLDRRIDPDQHIDFTARDIPLESLWLQIAAAAHAETAVIGSVVYIGPHDTAALLPTTAAMRRQDITRLSNE